MRASPLVLGGRQRDTMQHPLTGATCVALPNVGMCPQLSCALTFMYLQQVRRASSLGGCFPGLGGLVPASRGCALVPWMGLGRRILRLDGRGGSETLVLRGARALCAQLFLQLSGYFERLILSLGTGSLKLQTAFSLLESFPCQCVR